MENVVTMSLDEYKNLILENALLKNKLSSLKSKIINKAFDEIKDSYIDSIKTSNEALQYLRSSDDLIFGTFATNYSYTWRSISEDTYYIMSVDEIKELVLSEIKKRIDEKYTALKEEEKETDNGNEN